MSTDVIILAAGYGKRMQSEVPKVLIPLHGKPLLAHVLEAVAGSQVCERPVVVVGQKKELVMETIGTVPHYVVQAEQLGTGHAVASAEELLKDTAENVMVVYGDQPFYTGETLKKMADYHASHGGVMTMATVQLDDFNEWRSAFYSFGRIKRDENGKLERIIYGKNLTEEELAITEVDPAFFCFKAEWLWPRLRELKNENSHGEYYLTDLVALAVKEGTPPETMSMPAREALGANSPEDLEVLKGIEK